MTVVSPVEGVQRARIRHVPEYVSSTGPEAVELASIAGLHLDPWQADELTDALGERGDGKWASFEVADVVSRQNGKGSILEARQITGLFLLKERLQIHTAHQFKTCSEHFLRVRSLIENTDALRKRCKKPRTSHGEEEIETLDGRRLKFLARSRSSARGFTADVVYYDEAFELAEATVAASMPTLATRPNPQLWYTSSAVDQLVHPNGLVLARLRARALKGGDPSLAYFEHSADLTLDASDEEIAKLEHWLMANPGMGRRISVEHVEREFRSMDRRSFLVERLSVGDWPDPDGGDAVIPAEDWRALEVAPGPVSDPVAFAIDATPDRAWASVSVCGEREDGRLQVEVVEHRPTLAWVVAKVTDMAARWKPCAVVVSPRSAAGSLIPDLEAAGIAVVAPAAMDEAQACGMFYDAATGGQDDDGNRIPPTLAHLGEPVLAAALAGAVKRPMADAWTWDRKNSAVDISPLVSVTLAVWGWTTQRGLDPAANVW